MKEQGNIPLDQTNAEEIGSLHEKEFRVMIVKVIQNLGNRMEKIKEMFGAVSSTHHQSLPSTLLASTTRGQTTEARKTTILQPVDQKPVTERQRR